MERKFIKMVYSLEAEIQDLERSELAVSATMDLIRITEDNLPNKVSQLLQDLGLQIPVNDIINLARINLESPRCCSDG